MEDRLQQVLREVFAQIDSETAKLFLDRLKEIINEQKRTQENSGASR